MGAEVVGGALANLQYIMGSQGLFTIETWKTLVVETWQREVLQLDANKADNASLHTRKG
jgi:hypothetical protein